MENLGKLVEMVARRLFGLLFRYGLWLNEPDNMEFIRFEIDFKGRKCVMTKLDKLEQIIKIVKAQEEIGLAKAKSVIEEVKSYDIPEICIPNRFKKEEVEVKKSKCNLGVIIAIILGIIAVAVAIYGLYCYFTPDYLDDFDDDFEDDEFDDDDFFEDEDKEDESKNEE